VFDTLTTTVPSRDRSKQLITLDIQMKCDPKQTKNNTYQFQVFLVLASSPYQQQKIQKKDAANYDSDSGIIEQLSQVDFTPVNLVWRNKEAAGK